MGLIRRYLNKKLCDRVYSLLTVSTVGLIGGIGVLVLQRAFAVCVCINSTLLHCNIKAIRLLQRIEQYC